MTYKPLDQRIKELETQLQQSREKCERMESSIVAAATAEHTVERYAQEIDDLKDDLQEAQQNAAEIRRSITPEEHANIPQILHDIAHVSGLGEEAIRVLRYMRHTEDRLKEARDSAAMDCGHAFKFFQPYPYAIAADGTRIDPKCSECERIRELEQKVKELNR